MGRHLDDAQDKMRELHDTIGNIILAGYDWRGPGIGEAGAVLRAVGQYRSDERLPDEIAFFEQVRVWMVKFDAE